MDVGVDDAEDDGIVAMGMMIGCRTYFAASEFALLSGDSTGVVTPDSEAGSGWLFLVFLRGSLLRFFTIIGFSGIRSGISSVFFFSSSPTALSWKELVRLRIDFVLLEFSELLAAGRDVCRERDGRATFSVSEEVKTLLHDV